MGEKVQIIAARYSANGQLLEFSNLKETNCTVRENGRSADSGFYFGTYYRQKCRINVKTLWDSRPANE